VRIDDLSAPHGIITRGVLDDGTQDDVPYALWVAIDGSLVLAFEDKAHGIHQFSYLPDLLPHIDDILAFLVLYHGVSDAPQLAGAQPSA
jgi:hypothetical protein